MHGAQASLRIELDHTLSYSLCIVLGLERPEAVAHADAFVQLGEVPVPGHPNTIGQTQEHGRQGLSLCLGGTRQPARRALDRPIATAWSCGVPARISLLTTRVTSARQLALVRRRRRGFLAMPVIVTPARPTGQTGAGSRCDPWSRAPGSRHRRRARRLSAGGS